MFRLIAGFLIVQAACSASSLWVIAATGIVGLAVMASGVKAINS